MERTCGKCKWGFDDEFRSTLCPHSTFPANDGNNNFRRHHESLLIPPKREPR